MKKTAENCGGRYPARTDDLLGVNERDARQIRHLAASVKRQFRNKRSFGSVSVPDHGTNRTNVEDLRDAVAALDWPGDGKPLKFPKPPEGHIVYFVGGDEGPVKIGWTQQPIKARLVCIQNGSPVKLHVLAIQPARREREKVYHRRFAKYRLHGEWFERSPEIQAEIDRLRSVSLLAQSLGGS